MGLVARFMIIFLVYVGNMPQTAGMVVDGSRTHKKMSGVASLSQKNEPTLMLMVKKIVLCAARRKNPSGVQWIKERFMYKDKEDKKPRQSHSRTHCVRCNTKIRLISSGEDDTYRCLCGMSSVSFRSTVDENRKVDEI